MASSAQVGQYWHQALKLRKHLMKQLEKVKAESASGVDIAQFEAIEGTLERFRLVFVHTIFLDFAYAVKENTEDVLWALHTMINSEYRRIQGRLKHSSHAVERRKTEKSYNNFLRVAQKFYKGYIQRLSARYDVPDLRRVAQGIDVEPMGSGDRISPVPSELGALVLTSCHSTLLRLGDLSRYRTQARHKNSGYETALTFYSLAHHLKPQSGYAQHQMGIVHLDQGNHLDIVYNFYRSWAVDAPHPNAKTNLEAEFKSLQLPNSSKSRQNASPATQDPFPMWFVRLHALFYKGETFPQQAELEGEVLHKLEIACHSEKSTATLLKMTLVNLSAHHVASTIYRESMSLAAFYQFTLRFNALFISHFCAAFESELKEAASEDVGRDDPNTLPTKITAMVETLLPVLRLYSMWLTACRSEVSAAAQAFGGVIPRLIQNLARVFTLLCIFTYSQALSNCPYLLPEDLEIRGFRPLSEETIPQQCRCFCTEDDSPKTHLQDHSTRLEPSQENLARILDILRCAYFLAEDANFPMSYKVVDNSLIFEYCVKPTAVAPVAAAQTSMASPNIASKNPLGNEDAEARSLPSRGLLAEEPQQLRQNLASDVTKPQLTQRPGPQDEEDLDDPDDALFDMLSPFLKPPTPQPQQRQRRSTDESSYEMHTVTANNVFGSFQTEHSPPGSVLSGKFAPLPWAWFNTPEPEKPADNPKPNGSSGFAETPSPYNSPRRPTSSGYDLDDPFATPGRNINNVPVNSHAAQQRNRRSFPGPVVSAPETAHGNNLLQVFSGTGVPRSSPFTQWDENQQPTLQGSGPAMSPWGPRVLDSFPQSTGTSIFSHPSSLYQSTPANVVGRVMKPVSGGPEPKLSSSAHVETAARCLQMDRTTLNYNEAIMQSAYHGNK
ncbi:Telomerase activating protein Est1 [Metarhizium album ARSEF 1941]|uniref:Nonsense-mediated mRNA decay factor n=1 Tax=Metarhizium album (strain ARSEF 1941) TaxID=1081103 RepID=A0A0B2WME1_METAS|nr:Telomerase activating protein Est1 [Metarhizium album ARSEF 1941]KHN95118.1 Telomerase activating protein Est1 [Metarhizium album ARSEF 1941]